MGLMLVGCWWTELGKRKTENEGPKTVCGLKIRSRSPLLAGWATVITGEGAGMPPASVFRLWLDRRAGGQAGAVPVGVSRRTRVNRGRRTLMRS